MPGFGIGLDKKVSNNILMLSLIKLPRACHLFFQQEQNTPGLCRENPISLRPYPLNLNLNGGAYFIPALVWMYFMTGPRMMNKVSLVMSLIKPLMISKAGFTLHKNWSI